MTRFLSSVPRGMVRYHNPGTYNVDSSQLQANTASIHELYALASDVRDYATQTMLHWFIDEQVEEEQWCQEALDLLEMVGDNRSAILMLDKRYGEKGTEGQRD